MGGPGSGTWYRYSTRATVESYRALSIGDVAPALQRVAAGEIARVLVSIAWYRNGEQTASILAAAELQRGRPVVRLAYTSSRPGGEPERQNYQVLVSATPSNLPGNPGRRWWFICPLVVNGIACGRRVAKLYGGTLFGCRHCHDLTYTSCNESHQLDRLSRSLGAALAAELGGMNPDDVAAELRRWADPETLRLMAFANQVTRQSKKTEKMLRKMGLA